MASQHRAAKASYSSGPSDQALLGETIGSNLVRTASAHSERDALVDVPAGRRWNYRSFLFDVDQLGRALMAVGVARGDRVGIWSPNCAEWVLLQYATARIGAILVCINPAYRTHELTYVLRQAGVKVLVAATNNRGADYREMIRAARSELPQLERVVFIAHPTWFELLVAAEKVSALDLTQRAANLSFDDPINIQFTSGTTGSPKGATLTHHNILNNGYFVARMLGYTENDRVCLPVPFYHCFGMVMGNLAATSHGAAIVIPAPNFDPAATLAAVAQEQCTSLFGVPTMFIAELESLSEFPTNLSSLRTGIMAGAPCPAPVMLDVFNKMNMREVAICYGMTETSPVSTMTRRDDDLRHRTETVGVVMPHVEVKIIDPSSGNVAQRGVVGELCTRGYSVMVGYWDDPVRTAEAIDSYGWMRTGDLAVMHDDEYVSIVGRSKDMVIRGGENIYPREIEDFLQSHPDVAEVQVVGVPDDRYGEELVACVRVREGADLFTYETMKSYCDGKLARYKIPRYVRLVSEFPMTITGKVRKVDLRGDCIQWLTSQKDTGQRLKVDRR